jgi:hypothetical protein
MIGQKTFIEEKTKDWYTHEEKKIKTKKNCFFGMLL